MKEISDVLRLAAELAPELVELIRQLGHKEATKQARVIFQSHLQTIKNQRAKNDAAVAEQIAAKQKRGKK